MQVIIDAALFSSPGEPFDLLALFRLAHQRWHTILTSPIYDSGHSGSEQIDTWLAQQTQNQQKAVRALLILGIQVAAGQRRDTLQIRIGAAAVSDWLASPPRLTLADGLALLHAPLLVHVENRQSDGRLLRALAVRGKSYRQLALGATEGMVTDSLGGSVDGYGTQATTRPVG